MYSNDDGQQGNREDWWMRTAFDAKDAKSLFEASHELKGVYASLGLTPLYDLCSEIVEIARAGGLDGVARAGRKEAELPDERKQADVLDMRVVQTGDERNESPHAASIDRCRPIQPVFSVPFPSIVI